MKRYTFNQKVLNDNTVVPVINDSHIEITGCENIPYRRILRAKKVANATGAVEITTVTGTSTLQEGEEYRLVINGTGTQPVRAYSVITLAGWAWNDLMLAFESLIDNDPSAWFSASVVTNVITITGDTAGEAFEVQTGGSFTAADTVAETQAAANVEGDGTTLNAAHPDLGFVDGEVYTKYTIEHWEPVSTGDNLGELHEVALMVSEIWFDTVNAATVIGNLDTIFLAGTSEYLRISTA